MDDRTHTSFRDVIGLWPTIADFARAVDVPYERARQWHTRNSIPGDYFLRVTSAARRQRLDVGLEDLARLAARERVS